MVRKVCQESAIFLLFNVGKEFSLSFASINKKLYFGILQSLVILIPQSHFLLLLYIHTHKKPIPNYRSFIRKLVDWFFLFSHTVSFTWSPFLSSYPVNSYSELKIFLYVYNGSGDWTQNLCMPSLSNAPALVLKTLFKHPSSVKAFTHPQHSEWILQQAVSQHHKGSIIIISHIYFIVIYYGVLLKPQSAGSCYIL